MEDLIADYERTRKIMFSRIALLRRRLKNEPLMNMQRERLKARLQLLITERYELLDAINEMRKHL